MATLLESAALLLVAYKSCMFIIGLVAKDNSLIDIACGPAFVVASWGDWLIGGNVVFGYCCFSCRCCEYNRVWGLRCS